MRAFVWLRLAATGGEVSFRAVTWMQSARAASPGQNGELASVKEGDKTAITGGPDAP